MTIRPKTKRRVLILLAVLTIFVGGAGWLYSYRMRVAENRFKLEKQQGMDAYRAGDYQTAVDKLRDYINHAEKHDPGHIDLDALLAFSNAAGNVPSKSQDYVVQSINVLRQYCVMVPENTQAADQLIAMEAKAPFAIYAPDALARAGEMLKKNPQDLVALRAVAEINFRNRKFPEAAPSADQYTELAPTDLELQRVDFQIMRATGRPGTDMQQRADALLAKYPADPRFKIVKAWAYLYGQSQYQTPQQRQKDVTDYKSLIVSAAKQDPPNTQFAMITVDLLDRLGEFSASQDLLSRAAKKFPDPWLTQQLVLRLWENRKDSDVLSCLKDMDPASPKTDPQLIAIKALSSYRLGDRKSGDALTDALASRGPDDRAALAWATTLKAQFGSISTDLKSRLEQYRQAQDAQPDNGYIAFMLGTAYSEMDEGELALQSFRQASKLMPGWTEPHVYLADMLVRQGKGASEEAVRAADDALLAGAKNDQSTDLQAAISKIKVSFAMLPIATDPGAAQTLLDQVKQIQSQIPGEPETLPIYVALLSQLDQRPQAIEAINTACKNAAQSGEDLLMNLAEASKTASLGMEDTIYSAIQAKFGMTPRLAYARAMQLFNSGKAADGLQLMINAGQNSKTPADSLTWQRAICQYREASHDPGAAAAWEKLGDANPDDIVIQSVILTDADSAWTNRPFIERSIDRLKKLTGDDAIGWKTARARWLLTGDSPDRDLSEAVVLLTGVTTSYPDEYVPHTLLAIAYDKLKNFPSGLDEWRKAARLAPQSASAEFNLLKALHKMGHYDEARDTFDIFTKLTSISPDMALSAATIMAAEGDMKRAEQMLLAYPTASNQVLHDATLAKVYRVENRPTEAAAIYFNLANSRSLDVSTIREAADFFGTQRQLPEAYKFLDRLTEQQLPAGERELILAGFEEDHGSAATAEKDYDNAVVAAPDDPAPSIQRAEFLIRAQNWTKAQTSLETAAAKWPANDSISNLEKATASFAHWPHNDELVSLIRAISTDPLNPSAIATVAIATDPAATSLQVQELLDKHPDFEPLYELAARGLMSAGHPPEASAVASRAMERFPRSVDAARTAAEVSAAADNWNDAILNARQWRERAVEDPRPADLFIATSDLMADLPQDAVDRLATYIPDAKANPQDNRPLLTLYAQALILAGNQPDAQALLMPLAQSSPQGCLAWLDVAPVAFHDGDASAQWIAQIHSLLDPKSLLEQSGLAESLLACAERQDYPADYALARDTLKPFLQSGQMTASQWLVYAGASAGANDNPSAEQGYRQALKLDPDNVLAENNLADLLRQKGDANSLKEAETLATQAVTNHATDPNASAYLDTLARIFLKEGRPDDAIGAFAKANALNPKDLSILIGLASACADNSHLDSAVRYLSQIDNMVLPTTHLDPELAAELDHVRQAVGKMTTGSSVSGTTFTPGGK